MQLPTLIENSSNDGTDNDLMVPRISVLKDKIADLADKIRAHQHESSLISDLKDENARLKNEF